MGTLIKNPIVYTFVAIGVVLLCLSIFVGIRVPESLQLIFIPYSFDISHGVGETGSKIFRAAMAATQFGLITLAMLGSNLKNSVARRVVWCIGVLLVIVYFVTMTLGYLINNFH